jgi:hypothetical protein
MNINKDILRYLQQLMNANKDVRLINAYQGVPIAYPASIIAIDDASIALKTEKYQIVCLYRERETFIQSSYFPLIVHARVEKLDIPNLMVVLTELRYIRNNVGDRRNVRVWPKEPIQSGFQTSDVAEPLIGDLADLAQDGLAIFLRKEEFSPRLCSAGTEVKVMLRFPGDYEVEQMQPGNDQAGDYGGADRFSRENLRLFHLPALTNPASRREGKIKRQRFKYPELTIQGVVANIYEEKKRDYYRLGIRILPNDVSGLVIKQFVSRRQAEILRELKEVSDLIAG